MNEGFGKEFHRRCTADVRAILNFSERRTLKTGMSLRPLFRLTVADIVAYLFLFWGIVFGIYSLHHQNCRPDLTLTLPEKRALACRVFAALENAKLPISSVPT